MEPFIGEIKMFGLPFAPRGWALCNGQLLPINQNQALFSILGTTYGGDGVTTFALPDLRGRVPVNFGQDPYSGLSVQLGQKSGEEQHTLTQQEMPAHTHNVAGSSQTATSNSLEGMTWAVPDAELNNVYSTTINAQMSPSALPSAGGSQPHSNMQPYTVINFCIALVGIYPSRN
jgi:Microcystin-dependent protein